MKNPQLRVLLVANEGADYSAVRAIPLLETVAYSEASVVLDSGVDEEFDAMLLDGAMLDESLVSQIAAANPRLPIVVIARSLDQEDLALSALDQGADDYLMESELTPVSICGALRNARRYRNAIAERNDARHQLRSQRQGTVPQHLCERLQTSLTVVEALADTMARQLEGHPAAAMSGVMMDELGRLQQLTSDLTDSRRIRQRNLVMHRSHLSLGNLAENILHNRVGRNLRVEAGAQWDAPIICDSEKTCRAITRIIECLEIQATDVPWRLMIDDIEPRIGIRIPDGEISEELRSSLLSQTPVPVGEAGFERVVALGLLDAQQINLHADESTIWFDIPASAQQLTTRWTEWLGAEALTPVTLFELCAKTTDTPSETDSPDEMSEASTLDWVDAYLQQSVSSQDLVLAAGENRWLVAIAASGPEAERRMRHLNATARVVDATARFASEIVSTYHLPLQRDAIDARISALISSRRVLLLDKRVTPMSPMSRRLVEAGYDVMSLEESYTRREADKATAIVADLESLEALEDGGVSLPNIPVFLVGSMKDQQRAMEQNVRFVNQDVDGQYEGLIDALEAADAPAPYGMRPSAESKMVEIES